MSLMTRGELDKARVSIDSCGLRGRDIEILSNVLYAVIIELRYMNDSRDLRPVGKHQDYRESEGGFVTEVKVGGTD